MARTDNDNRMNRDAYRQLRDLASLLQIASHIAAEGDENEAACARLRVKGYLGDIMELLVPEDEAA